jgi:hypothetical protein
LNAFQYPFDGVVLKETLEQLETTPLIKQARKAFEDKTEEDILEAMIDVRFMYGLRMILKNIRKSKLYKFIFLIVNRLFGVTCFQISRERINTLATEWAKFEYKFKGKRKGRKNSYSYNVFLHSILQKNNVSHFKLITLPINHVKVRKEIDELY